MKFRYMEYFFRFKSSKTEPIVRKIFLYTCLTVGGSGFISGHAHAQALNNCMGDVAVGNVNGVSGANDLVCTSNDVRIAETEVLSGPTECTEGDIIDVELAADLQSSSDSSRSDIGIWLAEDGGDAVTGSCQHFYFETDALEDLDDSLEDDSCGDIGSGNLFEDVPLDTPTATLQLICRDGVVGDPDNAPDGELDVGSCIGWKVPGQDAVCDADGDYPKGTLPGTKSKCNCGNITIPIIVNQEAYVEVIKQVIPEDSADTFDLLINGVVEADDIGDEGTTGRTKVAAGTATDPGAEVTVSEEGAGLDLYTTVLSCVYRGTNTEVYSGSPNVFEGTFEIQPDDDIVCTFTNEGIPPKLTVVKTVVGGGADPDDFDLMVGTTDVNSGATNEFGTGSYVVSETLLDGYTAGDWGGDCDAAGNVSLALGDEKICTITNTGIPPKLTVVKTVVGGGADPDDFDLMVGTTDVNSGVTNTFDVGAYVVSETLLDGYTAGDWGGDCDTAGNVSLALGDEKTCTITNTGIPPKLRVVKTVVGGGADPDDFDLQVGTIDVSSGDSNEFDAGDYLVSETLLDGYTAGDWGGDCDAAGNVSLALGDDKTCTITNTGVPPKLTVVKTVVGGDAAPDDFNLTVGSTGVNSGVTNEFSAGSYVVSETLLDGYTAGDWGGDCDAAGNVSLALGDEKTCTITNAGVAPKLTVVKTVVGGGAAPDDFDLKVGTTGVSSGVKNPFDVGSYVVSETLLDGYTAGDWGGDCDATGNVSLALGDDKTCTITNTLKPTYLTLIKKVENPKGAPLEPVSSFLPLIAGSEVFTTSGERRLVAAGDYALSETNNSTNYELEELSCTNGGTTVVNPVVSLEPGEDVTCTFINRDNLYDPPGYLKVIKVIDNQYGGAATCSNFNFTISNSIYAGESWPNGTTSGSKITCMSVEYELVEGVYTATEDPFTITDYTKDESNCVNVTVIADQVSTCTIYNNQDEPPVENYPTRTIGYWKTHPKSIEYYLSEYGEIEYCGGNKVTTTCEAVAVLSQRGGGAINAERQSLAAALNCLAFDCNVVPSVTEACTGDNGAIWDAYNSNPLTDGIANPKLHGKADRRYCR